MRWRETAPELLTLVFWLFGPGFALLRSAGARGMVTLLVAPAVSVGTLASWAVLFSFTGIPWGNPAALGGVVLTVVAVAATRKVVTRIRARSGTATSRADILPRSPLAEQGIDRFIAWASPWLGVVVGGALGAIPVFLGMTRPDLIPVAPDTLFHLNSVQAVLESANASSFDLRSVIDQVPAPEIYPAAWAGLVALSTSDSVVAAANVLALCIAGLIWPFGLAGVARAIAPSRPGLALVMPVVGSGLIAFPTRLLSWGLIWPNALSLALVPAVVACTVMALRRPGSGDASFVRVGWVLATAVGCAGLLFAQPNGLLTYAVIATPLVISRAVGVAVRGTRALRAAADGQALGPVARRHRLRRVAAIAAPLFAATAWCAVWSVFWVWSARSARGAQADWFSGFWQGIWPTVADRSPLLEEYFGVPSNPVLLVALIAVGFVAALAISGTRWIAAAYLLLLAIAGISTTQTSFTWLGDAWWGDLFRIRAAAAIGSALLVGLGVYGVCAVVVRGLARAMRALRDVPAGTVRARDPLLPRLGFVLQIAALIGLAVATGAMDAAQRQHVIAARYQGIGPWPADVTQPELQLLERIGSEIPDDGLLIGAPASGAAFAFAVSDVDVVFRTYSGPWGPDATFLFHNFHAIHDDPEVCAAVERLGATHFYTDLDRVPAGGDAGIGLAIRAPQPGFRLIDHEGTARVYEITACD